MAVATIADGETVTTTQTLGTGDLLRIADGGTLALVLAAPAVHMIGADSALVNEGTISLRGVREAAVQADAAGALDLRVRNQGSISGLGGGVALRSEPGSTGQAIIVNGGAIEGNQGAAIDLAGLSADAVKLTSSGRDAGITSAGATDVMALGGDIRDIFLRNAAVILARDDPDRSELGDAIALGDAGYGHVFIHNYNFARIEGGANGISGRNDAWIKNRQFGEIIGRNGAGIAMDTDAADGTVTIINQELISGRHDGLGGGAGVGVRVGHLVDIFNIGDIVGVGESGDGSLSVGVRAGGGTVQSGSFGRIAGVSHGILIDDGTGGAAAGATHIVNAGSVAAETGTAMRLIGDHDDVIANIGVVTGGAGIAIEAGDGADTVRNSGRIVGSVDLGAGDDLYRAKDGFRYDGIVEGTILGGAGNDVIIGSIGADRIAGGAGRDRMTGGGGADVFLFGEGDTAADAGAADMILDLQAIDTIDLSAMDADGGVAGDQAFAWVGTAAFSGTAGELRAAGQGAHTLIEGDTDGDGAADLAILIAGAFAPADIGFAL